MSYASTVLADSPVSYWRLGEASGTNAADVQSANPGTYTGGVTLGTTGLLTGDSNTAVTLDGSTGYINVPSSSSLNTPAGGWSLEAWIKPSSLGAMEILRRDSLYAFELQGNGVINCYTGNGGSYGSAVSSAAGVIVAGNVYHVVFVFDGTNRRIYVNGSQVASDATTNSGTTTNPLNMGRDPTGIHYLVGVLDEAAVYNTGLSAARVLAHYNAGITAPSSLAAFHRRTVARPVGPTGGTF